jgi:hypothetical protein
LGKIIPSLLNIIPKVGILLSGVVGEDFLPRKW